MRRESVKETMRSIFVQASGGDPRRATTTACSRAIQTEQEDLAEGLGPMGEWLTAVFRD